MASDIRSVLRTKFRDMYRHMPELFPAGWDKNAATEAFETVLYKFLRVRFPVFRLCANNWKPRQFMIEWYPNWRRRVAKRGGSEEEEEDMDVSKPTAKKRSNEVQDVKPKKKAKTSSGRGLMPEVQNPLSV